MKAMGIRKSFFEMKKDIKIMISIIVGSIIIGGGIFYGLTVDNRIALKACKAMLMSDGSVKKNDLKEDNILKYILSECVTKKLNK